MTTHSLADLLKVVWDTIQTAVPRLLERLPDILGEAGRDPQE